MPSQSLVPLPPERIMVIKLKFGINFLFKLFKI